jgi:ketosteroid isomerase-like protein
MEPIEVMRSYLGAMRAGDREAAFDHYADDVVGYVPGRSAFAGRRRGRAAVEDYIRAALARAGGEATLELVDTLVGQDHVALLVRERLGSGADALDIRRANVYRIQNDKIVEIRIFEADQYAVDAWFAAPGS